MGYKIIENAQKSEKAITKIRNKGIDGIVFLENQPNKTFVVFNPTQIKLADGTNTTFDANNPDIRAEEGGEIKIPHNVFYAKVKPIREGDEEMIVRVSTDEVGDYVAGYTVYHPSTSNKRVAYFKRNEFKTLLEDGTYEILKNYSPEKIKKPTKGNAKAYNMQEFKKKLVKLYKILKKSAQHQPKEPNYRAYVDELTEMLSSGHEFKSKTDHEKIAEKYGITDKDTAKEYAELAIIECSRKIIQNNSSPLVKGGGKEGVYNALVEMYNRQPSLTHRTSYTAIHQQYSTPAPFAYLMGMWAGISPFEGGNSAESGMGDVSDYSRKLFFEPTAGNGMLCIAGSPKNFIVNEIDVVRLAILRMQGFKQVLSQDATKPFTQFHRQFDAVITNPPFGNTKSAVMFGKYAISGLEQLIAARALDYLTDDGKAAIIIGGNTEYDSKGRLKKSKDLTFFNYLSHYFNLEDVINISGDMYRKHGVTYPIRIILVNGRKSAPYGFFPLADYSLNKLEQFSTKAVDNFEYLFRRMNHEARITNHD